MTTVELQVIGKKEGFQYDNLQNPKEWLIDLALDYNPQNIFYKLSGGTNMQLRTINEEAAKMFEVGKTVVLNISPKEEPVEEKEVVEE